MVGSFHQVQKFSRMCDLSEPVCSALWHEVFRAGSRFATLFCGQWWYKENDGLYTDRQQETGTVVRAATVVHAKEREMLF